MFLTVGTTGELKIAGGRQLERVWIGVRRGLIPLPGRQIGACRSHCQNGLDLDLVVGAADDHLNGWIAGRVWIGVTQKHSIPSEHHVVAPSGGRWDCK